MGTSWTVVKLTHCPRAFPAMTGSWIILHFPDPLVSCSPIQVGSCMIIGNSISDVSWCFTAPGILETALDHFGTPAAHPICSFRYGLVAMRSDNTHKTLGCDAGVTVSCSALDSSRLWFR